MKNTRNNKMLKLLPSCGKVAASCGKLLPSCGCLFGSGVPKCANTLAAQSLLVTHIGHSHPMKQLDHRGR